MTRVVNGPIHGILGGEPGMFMAQSSEVTPPVFALNPGTSLTPTMGSAGSFSRTGTSYYYDSLTTLGNAADGVAAFPAFPFRGSGSSGGILISGVNTNLILQSEAPATTWTAQGTPTSVNNSVGTFLVGGSSITYGTIVTDAPDEGITQSTTIAASDQFSWTGSVYAATGSGTVGFKITISGDSGGTRESLSSATLTATTTPQRFSFFHTAFGATATGNVRMVVTVDAANTLRVGGMQLETGNSSDARMQTGSTYIKTTTATVTTNTDLLTYPSTNIVTAQGTVAIWIAPIYSDTELNAQKYVFDMSAEKLAIRHAPSGHIDAWYNDTQVIDVSGLTWSANVWQRISFAFDSANNQYSLRLNGVEIGTSTASIAAPTAATLTIGKNSANNAGTVYSPIGIIKIWNVFKTTAQDLADFNGTKGNYGL